MTGGEATVRVQPLGEQWVALGTAEFRDVRPEGLRMSSNSHGSNTCSFALRRDPGSPIPDLRAYAPVEVEIDGFLVWSGRIKETPVNDGTDARINVECEGWQYHLDDDHYERTYVHTRLGDWKDYRSFPTQDLTYWQAAPLVTQDQGIVLGFPRGMALKEFGSVGVTLDLGPDPNSWAKYIHLTFGGLNMNTSLTMFARGHDNVGGQHANGNPNTAEDAIIQNNPGGPGSTAVGSFVTARRMVTVFLYHTGSTAITTGNDHQLRLDGIRVFSENSVNFHSSGTSTLKASTIIRDAIDKATTQLSTDLTGVTDTTFSIPEFAMNEPRTAREVIEASNAFHDYLYLVDVDKRFIFAPKPAAPIIEIGSWPGVEFQDASANSGEEMHNKVTVSGTGPAGEPIRSVRRTSGLSEVAATAVPVSSPSVSNPDMNSNATGWSSNGTVSWGSGEGPDGSGAARVITGAAGTFYLTASWSGTFLRGQTYKCTIWGLAGAPAVQAQMDFGVLGLDYARVSSNVASFINSWRQYTIFWTPTADRTTAEIRWTWVTSGANTSWVDQVRLFKSADNDSFLSKVGLVRAKILPVSASITEGTGNVIGDVYLRAHKTTPFKGSFSAVGPSVRTVLGGQPVDPAMILTMPGKLVRVSHRVDPDTGAWGRDGTIAGVEYDHDARRASVQIDNQRRNFEAFLERLAVVTGNKLGNS